MKTSVKTGSSSKLSGSKHMSDAGALCDFLKLWVCDISTVDLVASAGPCSVLPAQHPAGLSAEQRLTGAAGWVTCGHLILPARVTFSFVM